MSTPLQEKARKIQARYADATPETLFDGLIHEEFPGKITLLSSFGAEAAILLYFAAQADKAFPVIFLDTKKLFTETLEYRNTLIEQFGLTNVKTIYPDYADISRDDPEGDLWQKDPRRCCTIRKVIPLERALKGYDAWITGRKRYHGGIRTELPFVEIADGRIKVNPLFDWNREKINKFFEEKEFPHHPLLEQGYTSIGCEVCTAKPLQDGDVRSGRWAGQDKEECGIHLGSDGKFHPVKKSAG
jgi:phosphoadenosine phosphosulfate reductase